MWLIISGIRWGCPKKQLKQRRTSLFLPACISWRRRLKYSVLPKRCCCLIWKRAVRWQILVRRPCFVNSKKNTRIIRWLVISTARPNSKHSPIFAAPAPMRWPSSKVSRKTSRSSSRPTETWAPTWSKRPAGTWCCGMGLVSCTRSLAMNES